MAALRHALDNHDQHDHGERDVEEEDPAPAGHLYQSAAEDGADRLTARDRRDQYPHPDM